MLTVDIPPQIGWDPVKEEFVPMDSKIELKLEHSLEAIAKWESIWKKPFLDPRSMSTVEEFLSYISCMTVTPRDVPLRTYERLTREDIKRIRDYMNNPMTATWFNKKNAKSSYRIITSEVLYCWMASNGIPFSCDKWHLNRLITLLRVCDAENAPKKQMSQGDVYKRYRKANAARRKKPHK